jgi:hypothetical protein
MFWTSTFAALAGAFGFATCSWKSLGWSMGHPWPSMIAIGVNWRLRESMTQKIMLEL